MPVMWFFIAVFFLVFIFLIVRVRLGAKQILLFELLVRLKVFGVFVVTYQAAIGGYGLAFLEDDLGLLA